MYNSLKEYMNIPYTLKPFVSKSSTGVKNYAADIPGLCYAEGKIVLVKNNLGVEVVSNKQLYIDGTTSIKTTDNIIFEDVDSSITAINTLYENGKPSIRVVYL